MKTLRSLTIAALLLASSAASAKETAKAVVAYKCVTKSGKVGVGTGRLSAENEYSSFLRKTARAGEYVIFRFDNQGREYWFNPSNCTRI